MTLPWRLLPLRESATCWMLKDPAEQHRAKTTYGVGAPYGTRVELIGVAIAILFHIILCFYSMEF